MRNCLVGFRVASAVGFTAVVLVLPRLAAAAPDAATKDRCSAYAQRAVQQFQLMQSHPGCEKNLDPLAWKADVDYHYNGCLLFPASMSKLAEQARDNHLQACGALAEAAAPPPPATPGPASMGAPETGAGVPAPTGDATALGQGAPPIPGPAGSPSRASPTGGLIGQCQIPVNVSWAINAAPSSGAGLVTTFDGRSLAYHGIEYSNAPGNAFGLPPKVLNGDYSGVPVLTAAVSRPSFFAHSCTGYVGVVDGPWIARSPGTADRYIWVGARGYLSWRTLTPDALKLLTEAATPVATAAKTPAPPPAANTKPKK